MDQNLLVESGIEDGQRLIRQLVRDQFEVTVTFWVKKNDDSLWRLYIASPCVDPAKLGPALGTVYNALARLPGCSVSPADIALLSNQDPIAREAVALRDGYSTREPKFYRSRRLGIMFVGELCIYPRRFPWKTRQLPDGSWQVLIAEPDDIWLTCDSEAEALAIAAAPVLEYEALDRVKSGEQFAGELEKTAQAFAKHRMSFGSRFFKRRAEEARN
jgi:hypothetical protein